MTEKESHREDARTSKSSSRSKFHKHHHESRSERDRERERSPRREGKEKERSRDKDRHRDSSRERDRDDKKRKRDREGESSASSSKRGKERDGEKDGRSSRRDKGKGRDADQDHASSISTIPTSSSLSLTSDLQASMDSLPDPQAVMEVPKTSLRRDDWMMTSNSKTVSNLARPTTSSSEDVEALKTKAEQQDRNEAEEQDTNESFFSNLGSERKSRKEKLKEKEEMKPDPEKLKISENELNLQLKEGKKIDEYQVEAPTQIAPGAPGHQWRMMKLRRIYEQAEEERRPIEEVALERYDSMESFNEARKERMFLDNKELERGGSGNRNGGRDSPAGGRKEEVSAGGRKSFMFTDSPLGGGSRPSSRQSFRKPGESSNPSTPLGNNTPVHSSSLRNQSSDTPQNPVNKRLKNFNQTGRESPASAGGSKPGTPIPNVFNPNAANQQRNKSQVHSDISIPSSPPISTSRSQPTILNHSSQKDQSPPLDASALNKLKSKVMKAELMGDAKKVESLKAEFQRESEKAKNWKENRGGDEGEGFISTGGNSLGGGNDAEDGNSGLEVLPTLDGRGRLYDVGHGKPGEDDDKILPGNRRPKKNKFETHDSKTGEMIRRNADDDEQTLAELVRQEKFGGGSSSQKDMDAEMASRIAGDSKFKNGLEYLDDNVERLARKKMKSDAMKRQFAIQDFSRTKKALDSCTYCWQEEGTLPPRCPLISSGLKTYLALPSTEPLTSGHCLIVPMFHHLSLLEAEEDVWDEIKNFMKCLMKNANSRNEGMVFFETVINLKWQKHSVIEAVNLPMDLYLDIPAYFKESIMSSESDWSQHQKLIDFSSKPFRRSMVPNLPYFMVQWDYKGEKGYGHVIEGEEGEEDEDDHKMKNGNQAFPGYFAAEVIGSQLDLEPRRWRNPKKMDSKTEGQRLNEFRKGWGWAEVDWTKMLKSSQSVGFDRV